MRLKEFFLIMFCAIPLLSFAEEQRINVDTDGWRELQARSISSIPVLSRDGNILFVYSDVPLENLQIQVKDGFGNIFHVDNICIVAGQKCSFVLEGIYEGFCVIELLCGQKILWGDFVFDS